MTEPTSTQAKNQYPSLGAAVRANSVEGAKEIVEILKERKQYIKVEEWTELLFKTLDTLNPEMAAFLRDSGADINASIEFQGDDDRAVTLPLVHAAIMADNSTLVQWMMDEKWIDENMVTPSGDTALVFAIRAHAFDVAQIFVDKGMSIDYQNLRGVSPLHEAASTGDYLALQWLMDRKADPTLETMSDAIACELVPENSEDPDEADQLFEAIDGYYQSYKRSKDLLETPDFITMKANEMRPAPEEGDEPQKPRKASMRA